jgi:hypothetical protein
MATETCGFARGGPDLLWAPSGFLSNASSPAIRSVPGVLALLASRGSRWARRTSRMDDLSAARAGQPHMSLV